MLDLPRPRPSLHPVSSCRRCGAPDHAGIMSHSRPPPWFFSSSSRLDRGNPRLPALDIAKLSKPTNHSQIGQTEKVQDWLSKSQDQRAPKERLPGDRKHKVKVKRSLPEVRTNPRPPHEEWFPLTSRYFSLGTVHGYSEGDFHREFVRSTPDPVLARRLRALPDSVASLREYMEFRRRRDYYFGRNEDFTDYMVPNKGQKLREGVGSILRPHSPQAPLYEGQRARYGDQSTARDSRDLESQRGRTYGLHEQLKTILHQHK